MHADQVTLDLSAGPILDAVDGYRGSMVDLNRAVSVDAAALSGARKELARRFTELGLAAGERVVMAVGNGPLFFATLAAILERGGSPLLTHVKTPPAELKRTSLQFGARFIVSDSWTEADMLSAAEVVTTVSAASWAQMVWASVDETDPSFQNSFAALAGIPLHPTSGTTGQPKVAARPGACAIAEAAHYVETVGIDESDVILAVSPMSHAYAYGMCVMVPLITGANVVSMSEFKPKLVYKAFQEHRITIFPAVPAMLDVLLFGAGERLRNSPRTVFAAGAPLPERVARTYRERSGTMVRPLLGTTETGGISVGVSDREALITGCVGSVMNGVSVEVRPTGGGSGLGEDLGSLCVRSSSMMAGYLSHEGIDRSSIENGWFRTGDLARIDAAGALHLNGREIEVVNVAGMKVVPSEVEEVIALLPGVAEVKVYSGTHRSGSQFVKAAIVAQGELDASHVREHCKKHLIYYKRPSSILFVDCLPKTPSGKIILDQLP